MQRFEIKNNQTVENSIRQIKTNRLSAIKFV